MAKLTTAVAPTPPRSAQSIEGRPPNRQPEDVHNELTRIMGEISAEIKRQAIALNLVDKHLLRGRPFDPAEIVARHTVRLF